MSAPTLSPPGFPAVISPCGRYRYTLWRELPGPSLFGSLSGPLMLWVMLNPSTADAERDDPTIRRCMGFATREGAAALAVVNLFAYRATKPAELRRAGDPVGPDCDRWIAELGGLASTVVLGWGARSKFPLGNRARDAAVLDLLPAEKLFTLGRCADGAPAHPLFLPANAPMRPFAHDGAR